MGRLRPHQAPILSDKNKNLRLQSAQGSQKLDSKKTLCVSLHRVCVFVHMCICTGYTVIVHRTVSIITMQNGYCYRYKYTPCGFSNQTTNHVITYRQLVLLQPKAILSIEMNDLLNQTSQYITAKGSVKLLIRKTEYFIITDEWWSCTGTMAAWLIYCTLKALFLAEKHGSWTAHFTIRFRYSVHGITDDRCTNNTFDCLGVRFFMYNV